MTRRTDAALAARNRTSGDCHVFMSTASARRMVSRLATLVRDDSGLDLVEYALLSALIGLSGLAIYSLSNNMGTAYINWNNNAQNSWEPCPPGGCPTP
jgi:Flp pilus assembly pilin Flp